MLTKKVISVFSFGILLLFVGMILKFLNYSQGNILMATGLVFELWALLLFISAKLKK